MGTTSFSNLVAQLVALAIEASREMKQGHRRQACISILKGAFGAGLGV